MNILITGASRGIGKAIATKFKENQHYNIYTPTRQEMDLVSLTGIKGYLADKKHIDIIINCAGINNTSLSGLNIDVGTHLITNFEGPKCIINTLLPHMKEKTYGRILNIGSIWIDHTKPGRGGYSISKAALHAYTKQIAVEYGQYGILSNTLSPGFINTDMTKQNNTDEELAIISNEIPVKRLGSPEEIAELAYFLTIKNTYINGQNIIIDGGYSICA